MGVRLLIGTRSAPAVVSVRTWSVTAEVYGDPRLEVPPIRRAAVSWEAFPRQDPGPVRPTRPPPCAGGGGGGATSGRGPGGGQGERGGASPGGPRAPS